MLQEIRVFNDREKGQFFRILNFMTHEKIVTRCFKQNSDKNCFRVFVFVSLVKNCLAQNDFIKKV
jgi:hypothetical protein